jgi:hypothetical protein
MTLLPMHFSENPEIDAAAVRLYFNMALDPFDHAGSHADKTVKAVRAELRLAFGAKAIKSIYIPVH